jgi:Haem-binding domain
MNFIKRNLKWCFVGAGTLFAALQFTTPPHTTPPVKSDFLTVVDVPPKMAAMFRSACYDCHSNETRWPWYSQVAPMSWQIAQDVNDGRAQLNLSEWPSDNPKRAWKKMEYTLIHKDARLTDDQRNDLTQWLDAQVDLLKSQAAGK